MNIPSVPSAGSLVGGLCLAAALLAACSGDNAFVTGPIGSTPGQPGTGAARDTVRPAVEFTRPVQSSVAAVGDSLFVEVIVSDAGGLARAEVAGVEAGGTTRYARVTKQYPSADTVRIDTVRVLLAPVGEPIAADPVLVIARSTDRAGNTREDTVRIALAVIRGSVHAVPGINNRLVDLVSDGRRVFISNLSKNRVEVFDPAQRTFSSVPVGSEPWGLALGISGDTLFVANSGGTNISVVALNAGQPRETRRIFTENLQLYGIGYDSAGAPGALTVADYSDRPQFVGQIQSGQLLYSTKPTGTAPDGTVRVYDAASDATQTFGRGSEIFTRYAATTLGQGIVVNALSATIRAKTLEVCPRRLQSDRPDPDCVSGSSVFDVSRQLRDLRIQGLTDTRFDENASLASIGLSDTTFIAVSGDRSAIAFGEGGRDPGRILLFRGSADALRYSSVETADLVGNAAERVIGLALNRDGSLGGARGRETYFFNRDLRLQGIGRTGTPSGGVALHPEHAQYPETLVPTRLAFISGVDDNGSPFVDVFDTFNFFRVQRIFIREAVTGALIAVASPAGSSGSLRLYGITKSGLLELELSPVDLQP